MSATALFRGMDRAALDAAYNNTAAVKDSPEWLQKYRTRSAPARTMPRVKPDIPYAPGERTKLDYFPVDAKSAPLVVFIHGGYWVRNSRDMFSYLAEGPNAHGINAAIVGYTLAPEARLSRIVDEISQSLTFLQLQAGDLGFDASRIFVSGWSAGGHLAAKACEHPAVRGALPISGIFDLEPVSLNYLNESLQLTPDDIETLSPLRRLRKGLPPQRLVVGEDELPELKRQTRDYALAARKLGLDVSDRVLPGHHHFSIIDELAKPDGMITQELLKLITDAKI